MEQRFLQLGCPYEPAGVLLLPAGGSAWRSVIDEGDLVKRTGQASLAMCSHATTKDIFYLCVCFSLFFGVVQHLILQVHHLYKSFTESVNFYANTKPKKTCFCFVKRGPQQHALLSSFFGRFSQS